MNDVCLRQMMTATPNDAASLMLLANIASLKTNLICCIISLTNLDLKEEYKNELGRTKKRYSIKTKKGLPFICASVVIWLLILLVVLLELPQDKENLLVFCCSCPLLPVSWMIGKILKTDIFDNSNPLGNVGFLFTCNQFLYLLIVMWVFSAVPDKMVMVYAMVFGAHLLPYSWLYKSISYRVFSIIIPIVSLVIGCMFSAFSVAVTVLIVEIIFVIALFVELHKFNNK